MKIKIVTVLIVCLNAIWCNAQISNYIYALNNNSSGSFLFCRIEIGTGAITNYQFATGWVSNNVSACLSASEQKYFLCTGKEIKSFDAVTGNLITVDSLPIAADENFLQTAFYPCDSSIYGIIHVNFPANNVFAKFNRANGTMTNISTLSPSTGFMLGGMTCIDPDSGIYIFENSSINGLDINTGQILYSSAILNLPNESFHHIALKCNDHQIYGTSADANAGIKYLSTIDPYTGIVTHVSASGWNVGIWKPSGGGDCINQITGNYFYSGAGSLLIEASTSSGNLINALTILSGNLYYVQHFSECSCNSLPTVNLMSTDTIFCEKQCIDFYDLSTNSPTSWQWFFPGSDSSTSTLQNPTNICYNNYGSFDITLIACNAAGCDTLVLPGFINEYQTLTPTITQSNDTLFSSPGVAYQWWSVDSGIIIGATDYYYVPPYGGSYYVIVTDTNGCDGASNTIIITGINSPLERGRGCVITPNPNNGSFTISLNTSTSRDFSLSIIDCIGRIVLKRQEAKGNEQIEINMGNVAPGLYVTEVINDGRVYRQKFVKEW